ncbi:MAG: pilus assembly protein N-terminal domain-containing protein [Bdellovibrionota bacterium]
MQKPSPLLPGHQGVITELGIQTVSMGDPTVATVNDPGNGNQIIVTAQSPGETNLILWKNTGEKVQYTIKVRGNTKGQKSDIQRLLGDIEGIKIYTAGQAIIIEGELFRGEDLERVQRISNIYQRVKNYTKVHPKALETFEQIVQEKLQQDIFKQISVSRAGDTLFLEGYVHNATEKERALKIAQNIYFKTASHIKIGVTSQNQVWVSLQFMEVMNDKLDDIGLSWPDAIDIQSNVSAQQFQSLSSTVSSNMGVTLKTMVRKGQAKILSNPKLLVRDGKKATFDAGGELPIRLVSERTADILFKSYGLHIEIDATTDQTDNVFLDIQSRISDLDLSTNIDGLPAIVEHKVNTSLDMQYGQTVALAGLIESRRSKSTKKFPFLGHVPILGELFKSRNFRNNHSEFVVFVTPYRGNANAPVHQYEKSHMDHRYHAMDQKLKFSILD